VEEFDTYRARIIESRERMKESLREVETNDSEAGVARGPVPTAMLDSPAAVYSLASSNLKRELMMLLHGTTHRERRRAVRRRETGTART
jgi:hypothetical protein